MNIPRHSIIIFRHDAKTISLLSPGADTTSINYSHQSSVGRAVLFPCSSHNLDVLLLFVCLFIALTFQRYIVDLSIQSVSIYAGPIMCYACDSCQIHKALSTFSAHRHVEIRTCRHISADHYQRSHEGRRAHSFVDSSMRPSSLELNRHVDVLVS